VGGQGRLHEERKTDYQKKLERHGKKEGTWERSGRKGKIPKGDDMVGFWKRACLNPGVIAQRQEEGLKAGGFGKSRKKKKPPTQKDVREGEQQWEKIWETATSKEKSENDAGGKRPIGDLTVLRNNF